MNKFAIIGFGCAGYHGLKAIRESGCDAHVDVYSETDLPPYNPMLTTYYVSGKLPYSGMFPFGSLEEISRSYNANFFIGERVTMVDAASCSVQTAGGKVRQYDKILIATGATAFVPPTFSDLLDDIYCMRTVEDALKMHHDLETKQYSSAVVVGASMVGIKVVELLKKRGIHVTLADMSTRIFPLAAYADVAEMIEERVQKLGVDLKLGSAISGAQKSNGRFSVSLGDDSTISCDMLVLNIGTRAATGIVDPAQIMVNRGIVVNDRMETSCPGIYAAGDCCEGMNLQSGETQIIGLWANAGVQGRTAGLNMAQQPARADGNIPHNITHFMDMDFIGIGNNRITGETLTYCNKEKGIFVEAVCKDGKLAGFNIFNNYAVSGICKSYFIKLLRGENDSLTPVQRGMLQCYGLHESFMKQLEERV